MLAPFGHTKDGVSWRIGAKTIECTRDGYRMRYSGYTLREALDEFRVDEACGTTGESNPNRGTDQ